MKHLSKKNPGLLLTTIAVGLSLTLQAQVNDAPCNALDVSTGTSKESGLEYKLDKNNSWISAPVNIDPIGTCLATGDKDRDLWFKIVPSGCENTVALDFKASPTKVPNVIPDIAVQIFSAPSCSGTFTEIACLNSLGADLYEIVNLSLGTDYYLRIFNANGSNGSIDRYFDYSIALSCGLQLPGTLNQTLRHDGVNWVGNDNIYNDGSNVGIGTNAPSEKLEIIGKTKTSDFQLTNGAAANYVLTADGVGNATWTDPNSITTSDDGDWVLNGSNVYNANSGNVGIGTSAPSASLHVAGVDASSSNSGLLITDNGGITTFNVRNNGALIGQVLSIQNTANPSIKIGYLAGGGNIQTENVFLGPKAGNGASGFQNVYIGGRSAQNASGHTNTVVGQGAGNGHSGNDNVYIGTSAGQLTGNNNIALGRNALAFSLTGMNVSNYFVAGSPISSMNNVYFGAGPSSTNVTNYTIHGTGARGSDLAGGDLTLAGGKGTGSGIGGNLILSTVPATGSGASQNPLVERMRIDQTGNIGIGTSTPNNQLEVNGTFLNQSGDFTSSNNGDFAGLGVNGAGSSYDNGTQMHAIGTVDLTSVGLGISAVLNSETASERFTVGTHNGEAFMLYKNLGTNINHVFSIQPRLIALRFNDAIGVSKALSLDNNGFAFSHTANGDLLNILNNGNVGVGIATPSEKLEVNGNIKADGTVESTSGGFVFPDGSTQVTAADLSGGGNGSFVDLDVTGRLKVGTASIIIEQLGGGSPFNHIYTSAASGNMLINSTDGSESSAPNTSSHTILNANNNTGNVGIGISNPLDKLSINSNNPVTSIHMTNSTSGSTSADGMRIFLGGNNVSFSLREAGAFSFFTTPSAFSQLAMIITKDGEVGIGTTNPVAAKFVVKGDGVTNNLDFISTVQNSVGDHLATVYDNTDSNDEVWRIRASGNGHPIAFNLTGKEVMRVQSHPGGFTNVGIGTSSPDEGFRLDVCGPIRATEIVVEIGWCDYVFEEDYDLMPLDELGTYLETNKHLPNIPPAAEVESDGLKLAEMQTKMMEKIEELTLYVIQLKTENVMLSKAIDELR